MPLHRMLSALLGCVVAVGCGGGESFSTASVHGTVSLDGQPVPGGTISLSPIASGSNRVGKPASGAIGPDGRFTLTTYKSGDGAVVGRHRVSFSAPVDEAVAVPEGGHSETPPSPYSGVKPEPAEVEVKPGDNTIDITLGK